MAQQDIASAGLPDKEWFSLDEMAERWGCSVDLLTHYAEVEMLRVCANFHRVTGTQQTIWTNAKGEDSTLRHYELSAPVAGIFGIQACDIAHLNRSGGVRPREIFDPDQIHTTTAAFFLSAEELFEEHKGMYEFIKTADTKPMWYEGGEQRPVWPDGHPPVDYVTKNMLLVTRVERDRFEQEHRIGAHAGEMPNRGGESDLDPRVRNTYLKIIRVMDAEISLPNEPYKAAGMLQAAAAKHGLELCSAETLAKYLERARKPDD
ncbi:MAG: hypothetical protein ACQETK_05710 [Pseudomonadota bacterium]